MSTYWLYFSAYFAAKLRRRACSALKITSPVPSRSLTPNFSRYSNFLESSIPGIVHVYPRTPSKTKSFLATAAFASVIGFACCTHRSCLTSLGSASAAHALNEVSEKSRIAMNLSRLMDCVLSSNIEGYSTTGLSGISLGLSLRGGNCSIRWSPTARTPASTPASKRPSRNAASISLQISSQTG